MEHARHFEKPHTPIRRCPIAHTWKCLKQTTATGIPIRAEWPHTAGSRGSYGTRKIRLRRYPSSLNPPKPCSAHRPDRWLRRLAVKRFSHSTGRGRNGCEEAARRSPKLVASNLTRKEYVR